MTPHAYPEEGTSMLTEFVVVDRDGTEIDWYDPVIRVTALDDAGWFLVDNGYGEYEVQVPEGGRAEIREIGERND